MKNKIAQFLIAATLGLLSNVASAALVTLHTSASSIHAGEQFTLDVLLQDAFAGHVAGDELLAFGFNLDYDTAAFSLVSTVAGPLWTQDSDVTGLDLSGWAFPGIPDPGAPILLGQLTFTALSAGSFTFGVNGDPAVDFLQGLYYLQDSAAIAAATEVSVAPPVTPVPLPPAAWLLGSGLFALMKIRRRHA